jgi:ATP-dependent helicase HrpB
LFGQANTPRVGKGNIPVLVHLLSPAKRPLGVTQDLPSFWSNVYPGIRKQMQAKYPRHVWPEDPMSAHPTSRTKKQIARRR